MQIASGSSITAVPGRSNAAVKEQTRDVALDRARTFVTLLVLATHAAVAYTQFGRYYPNHYLWSSAPIVDTQRWIGFNVLTLFTDVFFMPLMFLLSGLFIWPSLRRKGVGQFLRDRALRLALPFLAMIFLLMPVAYYASFRLTGSTMGFLEFWVGNFRQGIWFDGPGWFIWYLLFLDLLAIPIFYLAPGLIDAINRLSAAALRRPILFASGLAAAATMAYVPLLFHFGAVRWLNWGPLQVQLSRTVLYVVFFVAGIGVGAAGIDRGLLARSGMLARHWASWTLAAALSFGALSFLINFRRMRLSNLPGAPPLWWQSSYGVIYATSCTLICLAVLALFLRFAQEEKNILDPLRDDAYGIYVIHYVFCLWLQYGLLSVMFPATVKMTIVFAGTLAMAWVVTAALRRIPGARRVL